MPNARNLPSPMCPSCAYYEFHRGQSSPHYCKNAGSFTNYSKIGQNPDSAGTASTCKTFKPS
ncbi:MAG: hypothetical protein J6X78_02295 [Treponema sp.]|nr:hypothetical protein [Treponema sp.]